MPTPSQRNDPPSKVGTATLLDKDILEVILCTQAEQKWIDILSMLRRVNSILNHVAQVIFPELTKNIFGTQSSEDEKSWRFAFHRKKLVAGEGIGSLWEPTDPSTTPRVRNILDVLKTYPATLDIKIEAMRTLQRRTSHITKQDNYELAYLAGRSHATTLYFALSRHILRPNPYATQDLNSQIQEHTAATPQAIRTLCLGTLILESL